MTRSISWMLCLLTAGCVGCTAWHGPDTQETPTWDTDPGTATQDTDPCPDGTTVHEGDARVSNTDDVAALRCVREITGGLYVESDALTNLDGLEALERVENGVRFDATVNLVSIEGLRGLTSAGDLSISGALSLPSLAGLEHLATVRSVGIANNTVLVSVQALASISHLEGGLSVVGNFSLTSLDGLQGLTAIDSGLQIGLNANLGSIDALDGLSSLGGVMTVMSNPFLCQSDVDALAARLGASCVDCTDNGPDLRDCTPAAR